LGRSKFFLELQKDETKVLPSLGPQISKRPCVKRRKCQFIRFGNNGTQNLKFPPIL
jgi:hypothetical protein